MDNPRTREVRAALKRQYEEDGDGYTEAYAAAMVLALWWAGTAGLSGQAQVTAGFDALRTGLSIGIRSPRL